MNRQYMSRDWGYRDLDTPTINSFIGPEQMANHAIARLRCSLIAGTDLSLMRTNGLLLPGAPILTTGALVQDDVGHNGWHAAHAIPCSLIGGGRPIHQVSSSLSMQKFLAEPYRFTNVVPSAANVGDRRAEAFRQTDGNGLINAFGRFARSVLDQTWITGKSLDRGMLSSAYSRLFRGYLESFETLISSFPEQQLKRKSSGPTGTMIDFAPTIREVNEDDVRSSLRLQLKAMTDLGGSGFSSHLVDEVETDFHKTLAESKAISGSRVSP